MTARKTTGDQPAGPAFDDPGELRREIEHTRQELGDTVEALTRRLDVKARAQDKMADVRQRLREGTAQAAGAVDGRRQPLALGAVVALLLAAAIWWWRRRDG
jgi:hypothetical protein